MTSTTRHSKGFTIVELLIVIVVIAILAVITLVTYSSIQKRATNTKIISNVDSYRTAIELYKLHNGSYPTVPGEQNNQVSMACLGVGYPGGSCGVVAGTTVYESSSLMNSLQSMASNSQVVGLDFGAVQNESFVGAVYGIDAVGSPAPHSGYGRVIEWFLIGENQDCGLSGAYGYATGNGNTACEIFLEIAS